MRCLLLLAAFIVCGPPLAEAQELRRAEIFAGYSYLGFDSGGAREHLHGFEAAATGYVNDYFGVTGGVSGHFDSRGAGTCTPPELCLPAPGREFSFYNFHGGIQLKARGRRLSPFARALAGGSRLKVDVGAFQAFRESSFSFAAGGGLDLRVGGRVSLRLTQVEYLQTRFAGSRQDNVR